MMATHLTAFIADLERQRKALSALGGNQVNSTTLRASLRDLAEHYFADIRPTLVDPAGDGTRISAVNGAMQALVELCHKRARAGSYLELIKEAKRNLIGLDSALVTGFGMPRDDGQARTDSDLRIIRTLRDLMPSAALSFEQALMDLAQPERLSWRGPATDLREALRETLDRLAPDKDVEEMPGFKQEADARGPTMKQKVRFILRSREKSKTAIGTTEDATRAVDEAVGLFVRSVYTRSSVSTHTPTDKNEVLRVLDLVRVVLAELLEAR